MSWLNRLLTTGALLTALAASPALAALSSAPRRNPVNRSTLALSEVLTLRLVLLPEVSCPVTGSTRDAPSAKNSLADELAVSDGRKLPQALRRWAAAVRTCACA